MTKSKYKLIQKIYCSINFFQIYENIQQMPYTYRYKQNRFRCRIFYNDKSIPQSSWCN